MKKETVPNATLTVRDRNLSGMVGPDPRNIPHLAPGWTFGQPKSLHSEQTFGGGMGSKPNAPAAIKVLMGNLLENCVAHGAHGPRGPGAQS
jgi:hypothetical protein